MPKYQRLEKNEKIAKRSYLNFDVFSNRHYLRQQNNASRVGY